MWRNIRNNRKTRRGAPRFEMAPLERKVLFAAMPAPTNLLASTPEPTSAISVSSATAPTTTSNSGNPQVTLKWQDNSPSETCFQVYRALQGGTFWNVATCSANSTSYVDTNVAGGYTYQYEVRASDGKNVSDFSNVASATTAAETVPAAPSDLTVTLQQNKKRHTLSNLLTWQDNSNNEGRFVVQVSSDGVNWIAADAVGRDTNQYTDVAVSSGNTYYYRVAAYNSAGLSAWSNVFVIKT